MKRRPRTLYSADLPSVVADALDASGPAAAWAINVGDGRILAANAGGRAALGLPDGDGAPPVLDASTPALSLLREMAAAGDDAQVTSLTFWGPHGAQKFQARIHFTRAGPQTLALVTASSGRERAARRDSRRLGGRRRRDTQRNRAPHPGGIVSSRRHGSRRSPRVAPASRQAFPPAQPPRPLISPRWPMSLGRP